MSTRETTRAALLSVCAALTTMSATSYAQDDEVKEVTVTGSRLRRDEFQSSSPIQLITREETVLAGLSNTTETLQSTSVTSGSAQINNAFGGFVTVGGPGANTLGLRGLGAGRSLILLNGRRIAPAGARGQVGSVDLNVLPSAIIDRVEVLRDGASSVYGSDAIAGVINIYTLSRVEGLTLEGNFKSPFEDGGNSSRLSGVFGWNNDRLSVKASVDVYERSNLTLGDRDWTRCNQDYTYSSATGARTDFIDPVTGQPKCYPITGTGSNGATINTLGTSNLTGVPAVGAVGTVFNRWRPNSGVTTGLAGYEGVGGGANGLNIRDTFDPRMLNRTLLSPLDIKVGYAEASYKLNALGDAEIYSMFLANRRESSSVGYRQLSLDLPRGSPLIPANLAASQIGGAGFSNMVNGPVGVRMFIGFGNTVDTQEVDYAVGGLGLKGRLFGENWRYDAYVGVSKSDAEYTFQNHLIDRMTQSAVVVVAPAGTPSSLIRNYNGVNYTCAVNVSNPAANCVPAPGVSAATIGGQLPQDWVDYTYVTTTGKTIFEESLFSLNVDGPLFDMPAGEVNAALGVEFRRQRINDTPDPNSQRSNLYGFTASTVTRGKDSVKELYAEIGLPLLRDKPGAQELTVELSGRYTDYDSYGGDETYKATLTYKPLTWMTLRSTYGTSYRAPALFEQFLGATTGFQNTSTDPCNNWDAPGVNPVRRANCASEGLPAGFLQTSGITVFTQGGAAQGLEAETSDNFTVGLVFRPDFLPDGFGELALSADYYDIQIKNGVSRVGFSNLFQLCYDDVNFRSAASFGFCNYVQRDSARRVTVFDSYTNVASQSAQGIDYNLRYTRDIGPGKLRTNLEIQTFRSQELQNLPTAPVVDFNKSINFPKTTGELEFTYTMSNWRFRASAEFVGSMSSVALAGLTTTSANPFYPVDLEVPSFKQFHASVRYSSEKWAATFGMRNIGDEIPPIISANAGYNRVGNSALYSGYDYYGRLAFMDLSVKF